MSACRGIRDHSQIPTFSGKNLLFSLVDGIFEHASQLFNGFADIVLLPHYKVLAGFKLALFITTPAFVATMCIWPIVDCVAL